MSTFWFTVCFTVAVTLMTVLAMLDGDAKTSVSDIIGKVMCILTLAVWVLMAYWGIYLN